MPTARHRAEDSFRPPFFPGVLIDVAVAIFTHSSLPVLAGAEPITDGVRSVVHVLRPGGAAARGFIDGIQVT